MREAMDKGRAALRERRRGPGVSRAVRGGIDDDAWFGFRLPYVIPGFRLLRLGRRARLLRRGGKINFSAQKRSLFFARRLGLSLVWD
jgi:hypothetical protein